MDQSLACEICLKRFMHGLIMLLATLLYYILSFAKILTLSILISRGIVLVAEEFGQWTRIGPGLEAFLIIQILIGFTRLQVYCLKIYLKGTKLQKIVKKLKTAQSIINKSQYLFLIGAPFFMFLCFSSFHGNVGSVNEFFWGQILSLRNITEFDFTNGPISITTNPFNGFNLYSTLFLIIYSACVYLVAGDAKVALVQHDMAVRSRRERVKRRKWRSRAAFAGFLVFNFLKLIVYSIGFYYFAFGVFKISPAHPDIIFLFLLGMYGLTILLGVHSAAYCKYIVKFRQNVAKFSWFPKENYIKSQYRLHLHLVIPSVPLIFFKSNASFFKAEGLKDSCEFMAIFLLWIFLQTKSIIEELILAAAIRRDEMVFQLANSEVYRRRHHHHHHHPHLMSATHGEISRSRSGSSLSFNSNRSQSEFSVQSQENQQPSASTSSIQVDVENNNNNLSPQSTV